VLLIVTFRPEFEPPWIGRPYVTALTINRLAQRDIEAMIERVVGNELIPINVRQDIIERTDGIPLFVEEMTKAVLEAGSERAAERTVASIPSSTLAVPASLQASLMARLDRLGSAKEVAQVAAVIGREFPHALISAVARKGEPELRSALDRLEAAGLLFRQGLKQGATVPRMVGHRIMGVSLLLSGDFAEAREHLDRGMILYDPAEHRSLATRFAIDVRVGILFARSLAMWVLGYPEAALADAERALRDAREIGHAATLMFALTCPSLTQILLVNHTEASTELDEVIAYAGYSNRQQGANNIGQHMRPTPRGMGTLMRRVRTPSAEAQANAM
jgi:hypothetical protein